MSLLSHSYHSLLYGGAQVRRQANMLQHDFVAKTEVVEFQQEEFFYCPTLRPRINTIKHTKL